MRPKFFLFIVLQQKATVLVSDMLSWPLSIRVRTHEADMSPLKCIYFYLAPGLRPEAESQSGSGFFSFGVANRKSWDADWFARAVFRSRALALAKSLFSGINGELYEIMVLACQVSPFHLTLTQINSDMNCIAKNKCPESQKLDTRRRGENLNARPSDGLYNQLCS